LSRLAGRMPDRDIRSIVEACTRGNGEITEIESAVAAGADVNAASDGALRPLMVAVREKRADIVNTLLRLKADPNLPDSKGVSPLHAAIFDDTIDVVQSLIDFNADVHRRDRHGQTPLFFAPTRKACGQLARGKCDVNVRNLKGQSPLHLAAHAGLNDTVLWLVERMTKETINAQDKHGRTAVYCAAHSNLKSTILLLQENGADVQLRPHKYPQMKAKRALEEANRKRIIEARDRAPRSLAIDTTNSDTSMRDDLEGQISPKRPMDELRHLQDERNDADPEVLNELENLLKDREGVVADVQVDDFNASNEEKGWISGKPLTAVGPFIYPMRPFSEYYTANVTPNVPGFLEVLCKRDFPDARKRLEGSIASRTVMEEEALKKQVAEKIVAGESMAAMKSAEPRIAVETVAVSGGSTASMAEQARLKEEANRKQAEENRAAEEAKAVTKAEEATVAVAATVAAVAVATTVAVDAVAISGETSMPEEVRLKDEAARKQVEEIRVAEERRAVTKVEEKTVAVEAERTTVAVEAAAMSGQAPMPEKARLKEEAYRKQAYNGTELEQEKQLADEALARAMKEEEKLIVGDMLLAEEAKAQAMKAEEDERAKDLASTQVSPAKSEVMMKIIKQEDIAQKDQEDAVVKIQKIQRGRSDRMRVEKKRNAIPVGSSDFEGASVWEVPLRKLSGKQKYGFSHTNAKVDLLRDYTKASMPSAARMPDNMIPLDQTLLSDAEYPEALIIKKILDKGLMGDWNFIHPEAEVKPGDRIIEVNGSKTITDMQKQLRTSECICKVLRCPEVFHITLAKQPQRRFGFKFEKPAVASLRELKITEISKKGLLDEANRANMKMGLHHKVVLPGMRIEAVDEVEGDCFKLAEALRKCNAHVTLRIRRAEFFQIAQKKVGKSALVISAMQLGTGERMAVPLDTNEVEDRRSP